MSRRTLDLSELDAVPYFLWNENTSVRELKALLSDREDPVRAIYLARLLREARVEDVWKFVQPEEVVEAWNEVAPHLGARRRFWEFLLDVWRSHRVIRARPDPPPVGFS